jgi:RNA methyltransferase, TrmH family
MPDPIASRKNPLFRRIRKLDSDAGFRRQEGLFLLWGTRPVEEAMADSSRICQLVIGERVARQSSLRPFLRTARQLGVPTAILTDALLEELASGASDQGLLAVARARFVPLASLLQAGRNPLLLVADRIRDPGNLGILVRLAEAAQATALVTVPGTVDPYNTRAARASAGSILRVSLAELPAQEAWSHLRSEHRLRVVVTLAHGGTPVHRTDLKGPLALVLGNEGEGVSQAWVDSADLRVSIQLGGSVESLNVASAAAILLYEIRRQRSTL